MDVQQSQSAFSDTPPVECHDLSRRMAEVLELRAKVAFLEKVRSKTGHRAGKASAAHTIEQSA
jgi:hypothetical protein